MHARLRFSGDAASAQSKSQLQTLDKLKCFLSLKVRVLERQVNATASSNQQALQELQLEKAAHNKTKIQAQQFQDRLVARESNVTRKHVLKQSIRGPNNLSRRVPAVDASVQVAIEIDSAPQRASDTRRLTEFVNNFARQVRSIFREWLPMAVPQNQLVVDLDRLDRQLRERFGKAKCIEDFEPVFRVLGNLYSSLLHVHGVLARQHTLSDSQRLMSQVKGQKIRKETTRRPWTQSALGVTNGTSYQRKVV